MSTGGSRTGILLWGICMSLGLASAWSQEQPVVHGIVDLGHEFTFYADGRFHRQYLPGQPYASSWDALFNYDLSNANLLILLGCDSHLKYEPKDVATIKQFLEQGGGVVLLGAARDKGQNELAHMFGCSYATAAQQPLAAAAEPVSGQIAGRGDTLALQRASAWQVLVRDARDQPVLARRRIGKGWLLVGARGLAGNRPDASDDINASWWRPLLVSLAAGKPVDDSKRPRVEGLAIWSMSRNSDPSRCATAIT